MANNALYEFAKGNVVIDSDAIAMIAGYAATMSYGVVGMAYRSKTDTVANLLKKENIKKGIKVTITEDNLVSIDIHTIIQYGININAIAKSIIKNVKYQVSHMTGLDVQSVNVCVEGFRVAEEQE